MYCFSVYGLVQGVGFRPYIATICRENNLTGYVQNCGGFVKIEVNNQEKLAELLSNLPSPMRIDYYHVTFNKEKYSDFRIRESDGMGYSEIPPDLFLCHECEEELSTPTNRRYHYFFTTCTRCGPRYSMTQKTPYDRVTTTMNAFTMCRACSEEYSHEGGRRYHAQTIACPACGPELQLLDTGKIISVNARDAIQKTIQLLKTGEVVSIKGVGGFHWACIAHENSVRQLRHISGRKHKPYAVLCRNIHMVEKIARVDDTEKKILMSPARPIVVLPLVKKMPGVTELDSVGVMLPYTALHALLSEGVEEPIVLTSANLPDIPITTKIEEQRTQYILNHTRTIANPIDDSVVKLIRGKKLFLRRSRGYVPEPIALSGNNETILAMGGDLHNTFAIYHEGKAVLSPYLGNVSRAEAQQRYRETIMKYLKWMNIQPSMVVGDAHPAFASSHIGQKLADEWNVPYQKIYHHSAHAYAVMGEKNMDECTAIVCDGTGYGEDGQSWGGEVFSGNKRIGHLEEQWQLGGDSAAMKPAKMTYSILRKFLSREEAAKHVHQSFQPNEMEILSTQWEKKYNAPLTTSTGRILDAASYLLGFCDERTYEGRPAMLLEAHSREPYDLSPFIENNVLLTTPLFEYLIENKMKNRSRLAATVQQYIATGLDEIAQTTGGKSFVFGGGCAYNKIMTSFLVSKKYEVNEKVPCGDGGLAFGQLAYALANPRG
ncbi:MAG: carbamoyltransferase HypF [Candidatus Diapherotrites archaeon]|uniref:Carbamoyltransferase n=1 Tax=Candidatus Iainarchaeum sp. TaxID=3101447 RepID=A0A8T4C5H5_9ARCH|nr:carbamoyltransferase HypF [Candidatus Diapherotrites archaeon]